MLDLLGNGRPAGDILSRSVRFTLGGQEYVLPVRSIKANREWQALANEKTVGSLKGLEEAGNDLAGLFAILGNQVDTLLDVLIAYDATGVLPSRDEIESIEPDASLDILTAVQEVWRAANPLVGTAANLWMTGEATENGSSPPTSSPPRNGTSSRRRSKKS